MMTKQAATEVCDDINVHWIPLFNDQHKRVCKLVMNGYCVNSQQLRQAELQKQQAIVAQRMIRAQALALGEHAHAHAHAHGHAHGQAHAQHARRDAASRRRATCTVRVNNLHAAEAIETDVWLSGRYYPPHSARSSFPHQHTFNALLGNPHKADTIRFFSFVLQFVYHYSSHAFQAKWPNEGVQIYAIAW